MAITSQFSDMTSSLIFFWRCFVSLVKFSYWSKFHVNIINGSGIMTISFIRDWPEIRKSEIPPSEFCPISRDWGKLWIPNLVRMSLIECYWMLQIPGLQLLPFLSYWGKTSWGGSKIIHHPPPQIRVKYLSMKMNWEKWISHSEKLKFELIVNPVHNAEYLAYGKALVAKFYLNKVKVYTNLLSVHKILCLWNSFVWIFLYFNYSEHSINFFSIFVFFMTYLGYNFFLNVPIFTITDNETGKNQFF